MMYGDLRNPDDRDRARAILEADGQGHISVWQCSTLPPWYFAISDDECDIYLGTEAMRMLNQIADEHPDAIRFQRPKQFQGKPFSLN